MPRFLSGCWGSELRPSYFNSKYFTHWAIFLAHKINNVIIYMEAWKTPHSHSQSNLDNKKKNNIEGITAPDYKKCIHSYSKKNKMVRYRNRYQWNRIKDSDINPCSYRHLILTKKCKKKSYVRKRASSTNGAVKIRIMRLGSYLSPSF